MNKKATVYAQLFYRLYSKPSEKLLELSYNLAPPNRQTDTDTFFYQGQFAPTAPSSITLSKYLHVLLCNIMLFVIPIIIMILHFPLWSNTYNYFDWKVYILYAVEWMVF